MSQCPACARPVAMARPACLYCGARLPEEVVAQADAARSAAEATAEPGAEAAGDSAHAEGRFVVVLAAAQADAALLARALGLSAYEAGQCVRRRGWHLWRVGAPPDEVQAAGVRAAGAGLEVLPEAEVRMAAQPLVATGGALREGRLSLGAGEGLSLAAGDVLLIVRGPIARRLEEPLGARRRQPVGAAPRRDRSASLEPGLRIHLHLHGRIAPVELDGHGFELGSDRPGEATQVVLTRWIAALAAPVDDGFRDIAPALSAAGPGHGTADRLAASLRTQGAGRRESGLELLDNLEQFRFYSAWRGLVQRRQAAPSPLTAPRTPVLPFPAPRPRGGSGQPEDA